MCFVIHKQRANEYFKNAINEFPQCAPLLQAYAEYLDQVSFTHTLKTEIKSKEGQYSCNAAVVLCVCRCMYARGSRHRTQNLYNYLLMLNTVVVPERYANTSLATVQVYCSSYVSHSF